LRLGTPEIPCMRLKAGLLFLHAKHTMSNVYLVIRDEGEYWGREWSVEAVCSTSAQALARACKYAAAHFIQDGKAWQNYYTPFVIQTWQVDGLSAAGDNKETTVRLADIRQHHPELEPVIEQRAQAAATRAKLLQEAQVNAKNLQDRLHFDDQLRNRSLTVEQYYKDVDELERRGNMS
jgi:hypothetical protein